MATTITGASGAVTAAPGSSSSSRGSRQCISSPWYSFLIYLFKLYFFFSSLLFAHASHNYVAPPPSCKCEGGQFLVFFLHTQERIRLTWPNFCFTSERWCHLYQLTFFFSSFSSSFFKLSISFLFDFGTHCCKLPTGEKIFVVSI